MFRTGSNIKECLTWTKCHQEHFGQDQMSSNELTPNKNVRAILVGGWKVFLTNGAGTNGHPHGKEKRISISSSYHRKI